jgi:ferredoxin-type protein NapF
LTAEALSRRNFLRARLKPGPPPVRPPWTTEAAVKDFCTGCGACKDVCPTGVIALDGEQHPYLDFRAAECTQCGACAEACEAPVFTRSLVPAFAHIAVIGTSCLTFQGVMCRTCGETCREGAIRFHMRIGGPAIPELSEQDCTGCGACIATCPGDAITAGTRRMEFHGV